MRHNQRIGVVIPALNEQSSIGIVIRGIPRWVDHIVVADNGSTDRTADVARAAGATVVAEGERGYGAACQAGIAALDAPDIVVFLDGDFSDDPREMAALVDPIARGTADMVIGSRSAGAEPGSLTPQQKFGNWLACRLMQLLYGVTYTDLGPFRAVRATALDRLAMTDRNFGWTVEMQIKAAKSRIAALEVPVRYRRRIGVSKISGTLRGSFLAGKTILSVIARHAVFPADATGK